MFIFNLIRKLLYLFRLGPKEVFSLYLTFDISVVINKKLIILLDDFCIYFKGMVSGSLI